MLVRYVAERFLYRLGASRVRERCLLKGASLLAAWLADPDRTTRDVDLLVLGPADDEAIRALVEEACSVPYTEDGLRFDLSAMRVEAIRPDDEYAGKRARFLAYLGKARIHFQVDLGVGDAVGASRDEIDYPVLLDTLPAPGLLAYPREASIAEKFEAMVKLDIQNSRMNDFHDVWALSTMFSFDGPSLQLAIVRCFERRGRPWTADIPRALTTAFYEIPQLERRWRSYLAAGAILVPPPAAFTAIGDQILRFLSPVRESILARRPFEMHWPAGGPWRPGTHARAGEKANG